MNTPPTSPFKRDQFLVGGKLTGARWWQMQLRQPPSTVARRTLLIAVASAAGITLLAGGCLIAIASDSEAVSEQDSLDTQKKLGWSVGSETDALAYGPEASGKFEPATLLRLASELTPRQARLRPLYVPTLFQSVTASPSTPVSGLGAPLKDVLRPATTTAMNVAQERGKSFSSLFQGLAAGRAVLVDLPGPEAVAFAAGIADRFEPVFLFDNWPHPKGVVPAHLTLGAAAVFLQEFQAAAARRPANAPPAFILDRNRLTPYTDQSDTFDNRYLARTPPASILSSLGITQVLYVLPTAADQEADDINQDLVLYAGAGIVVRTVAMTDFRQAEPAEVSPGSRPDAGAKDAGAPQASAAELHYPYGGSQNTHLAFLHFYGLGTPSSAFRTPSNVSRGYAYQPVARPTQFTPSAGATKTRPAGFGKIQVVTDRSSGRVVGVRFGRSGSFGRGSWSGG